MTRLHLLAVPLLVAGCGGHDGMDMMSDHAAAMDVHLAAADLELHHHQVAVEATVDLDAIVAEEDDHAAEMADHDLAMTHDMDDMMGCVDRRSGDMDDMMDAMERMARERSGHMARMGDMSTVAGALDEEAAHQSRMRELMLDLDGYLSSMMGDGDMSCSHDD